MENKSKLVYEFDCVYSIDGVDKMTREHHANPVVICSVVLGKPATFYYFDKPELNLITTPVVSMQIHFNAIRITTTNTVYWLKPYIREEYKQYEA